MAPSKAGRESAMRNTRFTFYRARSQELELRSQQSEVKDQAEVGLDCGIALRGPGSKLLES